jgi:hypothetical protein
MSIDVHQTVSLQRKLQKDLFFRNLHFCFKPSVFLFLTKEVGISLDGHRGRQLFFFVLYMLGNLEVERDSGFPEAIFSQKLHIGANPLFSLVINHASLRETLNLCKRGGIPSLCLSIVDYALSEKIL